MFILTVTHSFNVQHTKHKGLCSSIRMTLKLVGFEFSDRIPFFSFVQKIKEGKLVGFSELQKQSG